MSDIRNSVRGRLLREFFGEVAAEELYNHPNLGLTLFFGNSEDREANTKMLKLLDKEKLEYFVLAGKGVLVRARPQAAPNPLAAQLAAARAELAALKAQSPVQAPQPSAEELKAQAQALVQAPVKAQSPVQAPPKTVRRAAAPKMED